MDVYQLKKDVIAYSQTIGIDKIGFASANPFDELKGRLTEQQRLQYESGFEERDIEKRTNPSLLLKNAKSMIAIALAYPSKLTGAPKSTRRERRGIFCRASWGIDYHHLLRDRLQKLEAFLLERAPDAACLSMVDTGALSDRAVAERAGIGYSAKNTSIITKEFGSYVYLGEMITSIPFPPDEPILDSCGDCRICIDHCPTQALVSGGQLNSKRCIAFLTQTKDWLDDEFREKIGNRLYGCDTCQQVCPKNKGINSRLHDEMEPDVEAVKPLLKPLLTIGNRAFQEKFGAMSGAWRGKKPIQRNAILALAHYKDDSSLDLLKEVMQNDPRPVIRGMAAWAIGKIGDSSMLRHLEQALDAENDEQVKEEIRKGIKMLKS